MEFNFFFPWSPQALFSLSRRALNGPLMLNPNPQTLFSYLSSSKVKVTGCFLGILPGKHPRGQRVCPDLRNATGLQPNPCPVSNTRPKNRCLALQSLLPAEDGLHRMAEQER